MLDYTAALTREIVTCRTSEPSDVRLDVFVEIVADSAH
jgi:hypothetical protein